MSDIRLTVPGVGHKGKKPLFWTLGQRVRTLDIRLKGSPVVNKGTEFDVRTKGQSVGH